MDDWDLFGVKETSERVLVGIVGHANDGGVEASVVDEGEVGGVSDAGEGIEEEVEG